jgi:hypothetical protein
MSKHAGCFVCGSTEDAVLRSVPDMTTMTSVALCSKCYALPNDALKRKLDAVREAVKKAREAAAAA